MSVETLRYCDLCGGAVDQHAAALVVPDAAPPTPTRGAPNEWEMVYLQHFTAQLAAQQQTHATRYDICRGCVDALLVHRHAHRERADVALKARVVASLSDEMLRRFSERQR